MKSRTILKTIAKMAKDHSGLSFDQLSEKSGISRPLLSAWCSPDNPKTPSHNRLDDLLASVGLTMDEVVLLHGTKRIIQVSFSDTHQ